MSVVLLILLVAIALVLVLRRPRPESEPVPPSYYARDDAFGRPGPMYGPGGMAPPQEGMGSSIARGVATGLAVGAGAAIAQELAHRAFDHGQPGQGYASDPAPGPVHDPQSHSQLARDAGIGALDGSPDPQGFADFGDVGWDDGGGNDDQGWDA